MRYFIAWGANSQLFELHETDYVGLLVFDLLVSLTLNQAGHCRPFVTFCNFREPFAEGLEEFYVTNMDSAMD